MTKNPTFDPIDSFGFLTNRVGRLLGIHLKKVLGKEEFDLPVHCFGILADLWNKDGVKQQDLAISIVKDKATIARALELMEKQNIIVRIVDEKDKRNKKIFLTHKGMHLQHKLMNMDKTINSEATKSLTKEEIETSKKVLKKMYQNLKETL